MSRCTSPPPTSSRRSRRKRAASSAREITRERRLAWDRMPEGHDRRLLAGGRPARLARLRVAGGGGRSGRVAARPRTAGRGVRTRGRAVRRVRGGRRRARAATRSGPTAQRREWLPADRARRARWSTLAVAERGAALEPARVARPRSRDAGRSSGVDGEKRFVLQGVTADAFLVAARDGDGVSVVLVPADAPGVTRRARRRRSPRIARAPSGSTGVTLPGDGARRPAPGDRVAAARAAAPPSRRAAVRRSHRRRRRGARHDRRATSASASSSARSSAPSRPCSRCSR